MVGFEQTFSPEPKRICVTFTHRNHLTSIKSHYGSHFKDFGDYGENCYLLKGVLTGKDLHLTNDISNPVAHVRYWSGLFRDLS